jgi:hypothetical protein
VVCGVWCVVWCVVCVVCGVVCGVWCVVCGVWCAVCGVWCVVWGSGVGQLVDVTSLRPCRRSDVPWLSAGVVPLFAWMCGLARPWALVGQQEHDAYVAGRLLPGRHRVCVVLHHRDPVPPCGAGQPAPCQPHHRYFLGVSGLHTCVLPAPLVFWAAAISPSWWVGGRAAPCPPPPVVALTLCARASVPVCVCVCMCVCACMCMCVRALVS